MFVLDPYFNHFKLGSFIARLYFLGFNVYKFGEDVFSEQITGLIDSKETKITFFKKNHIFIILSFIIQHLINLPGEPPFLKFHFCFSNIPTQHVIT